jgi:serine/threonine protein kinase
MTPERWAHVRDVLAHALSREGEARAVFVDEACGADATLKAEVESLLAAGERASDFLAEPSAPEAPPLAPGTRLGPYEVHRLIASGGMGVVYRALDTRLGRPVAVKVLSARLAGEHTAVRRFEREARAVAALSHPHILAIHGFGEDGGRVYAVTELLEGETLRERLHRGPVPPEAARDLALQIARGLSAAHQAGIVHRDLKPENLFVTSAGVLKILDFGLAKQARPLPSGEPGAQTVSLKTREGALVGTLGYMAPEQVRGEEADARADVFAFGVVLYEMLMGRRPFARDTAAESLAAVLRDEPAPLDPARVPGPLAHLLRRCLAKDRDGRFPSARELLSALESLPRRLDGHRRRSRRRRVVLLVAAIVLTGLAALAWHVRTRPRPVDATYAAGDEPGALAWDGRSLWVANHAANTVMKLEPASGRILATYPVGDKPVALAWDGAGLWVANHGWVDNDHSTLMRLDPADGRVLATYRLPGQPMNLALDGTHVWVTETWPTYVVRKLRAVDGEDLGGFTAGGTPRDVVHDGESLWVSNGGLGSLTKLRPGDGKVLRAIEVGEVAFALAVDGDHVWVSAISREEGVGSLVKVRRADAQIVERIAVPGGRLLLSGRILFASMPGRVTAIPLDGTGTAATFAVGREPKALAFAGESLWVANYDTDTVSRISARSLQAALAR